MYSSNLSLTSAPDGVGDQRNATVVLTPTKFKSQHPNRLS